MALGKTVYSKDNIRGCVTSSRRRARRMTASGAGWPEAATAASGWGRVNEESENSRSMEHTR